MALDYRDRIRLPVSKIWFRVRLVIVVPTYQMFRTALETFVYTNQMLAALTVATLLNSAQPPAIVMNSLLERTQFYLLGAEPSVRFSNLQVAFGPTTDFKCEVLVKEGEKTLHTLAFRHSGARAGVFTSLTSRTPGAVTLGSSDGPRRFEVMVDGTLAGKFEFNLKKTTSGDALDPKTTWVKTGPWKDHAFIQHKQDDGYRQDAYLVFFVGLHELKAGDKSVVVTVKKGTTVVATGDKRIPNGPGYSRFEQPLIRPNKNPITVKDLATMSGLHTVEVRQGANLIKQWSFSIANGGITPHPRSNHVGTDPLKWLAPKMMDGRAVSQYTMHWLTAK